MTFYLIKFRQFLWIYCFLSIDPRAQKVHYELIWTRLMMMMIMMIVNALSSMAVAQWRPVSLYWMPAALSNRFVPCYYCYPADLSIVCRVSVQWSRHVFVCLAVSLMGLCLPKQLSISRWIDERDSNCYYDFTRCTWHSW